MKSVIRYITALLLAVALGMGLLLLSTLLPQAAIDTHVAQSAELMAREEGAYPLTADYTFSGQLDNYTDAIILAQSKAMSTPEAILTNPMYALAEDEGEDPVLDLYAYVHAEDPQPTSFYVRYWMGFRAVMRLMLTFVNFFQLRRYLAAAVMGLAVAVICSIARHVGTKAAFVFGMAFVFVRPYIIVMSPQFSCCFLLAFLAMLAVPWLSKNHKHDGMFFLLLGCATMFFDFYTTPVVTFGLPFVYLYLLRSRMGDSRIQKLSCFFRYFFLFWGVGYLAMWFAKMILTTVFTDVNGLSNGLNSMAYRLGMAGETSSVFQALRAIWFSLYADETGKKILIAVLAACVIALGIALLRRRPGIKLLLRHRNLIAAAAVPVIWMLAAPQPFTIHHWFQYRSIAVSFFAFGLYCLLVLKKPAPSET